MDDSTYPIPRSSSPSRAVLESRFEALDYAFVALYGDGEVWQTHAARALLRGRPHDLERLAEFGQTDARLHLAASLWIQEREDEAASVLETTPGEHARNLLALIRKPRIRVLGQLPWTREGAHDLVSAIGRDTRFEVRNVSYYPGDLRNRPYASVASFLRGGFDPDFYIATMVEWHQLPVDLQELPCPLFGHTADYDLHAQVVAPWYSLFDELVTTDPSEWSDVRGLTQQTVSSFPKCFGVSEKLPEVPGTNRGLDFFVSGTLLDTLTPDKAERIHEVLGISEAEIRILRGHVRADAYYALLGDSKASFSYVRHPGATPTRGLETLAMGCALALQEESVLGLYVGRDEGVATYGPQRGDLSRCIREILENWPRFAVQAQRGAAVVREEFSLSRVASQYMRYLTFRAAAPRPPRRRIDSSRLVQKRLRMRVIWMPGDSSVRQRSMQENVRRLSARLGQQLSEVQLGDMARELLLEYGCFEQANELRHRDPELLVQALTLFRQGMNAFPASLALRFNFVRTALHYGDAATRAEGLRVARETLEADPGSWQLPTMADVMPLDFHREHFNYRSYFDQLHEDLARERRGEPVDPAPRMRRILASIAGYLARDGGEPDRFASAAEWDPDFAPFRLGHAEQLLRSTEPADRDRGEIVLHELADGSTVFAEAYELLERLAAGGGNGRQIPPHLHAPMRSIHTASFEVTRHLRVLDPALGPSARVRDREAMDELALSVLVPWPGSSFDLGELIADLGYQTEAARTELVVAVPDGEPGLLDFASREAARIPLRIVRIAATAEQAERLDALVREARAPVLTIACAGDRFLPNAHRRMLDALDADPDLGVVYGDQACSDELCDSFTPGASTRYRCGRPFSLPYLFSADPVGLQPAWRARLHREYGGFASEFGPATESEFWLRVGPFVEFRRLRGVTTMTHAQATWLGARVAGAAIERLEQARQRHWPAAWGEMPARQDSLWIPKQVYPHSIRKETTSQTALGALTHAEGEEAISLVDLYEHALHGQDFHVAGLAIRTCIQRYPTLVTAPLAYAEFRRLFVGPEAALGVLHEALAAQPYGTLLRKRLAVVLDHCGRSSEAEVLLTDALELSPRDAGLHVSLGSLHLRSERVAAAQQHFERAFELDPHNPVAIDGLRLLANRTASATPAPI